MSRFVIVSLPGQPTRSSGQFDGPADRDTGGVETDCAWLFSASPEVEDAEEALRTAIAEFFGSAAGREASEAESGGPLGWCEAIRWIPDEVWGRHGLTVFRHPDVERILLDRDENLVEESTLPKPGSPAEAPS